MHPLLPSLGRHARRLSPIAALAVVSLAACDADKPIAPTSTESTEIPTAAQPIVSPMKVGTLVIKLVDQNQVVVSTPLPIGAQFKVDGPGGYSVTFNDGLAPDTDPKSGVMVLTGLVPGLYKVCEIQPVAYYGISSPACQSTDVYAGATSGLLFLALPIARVQWTVIDFIPNVVGGAVFTLADSTNKVIAMFDDNSFTDSDPVPGAFQLQLYIDATFTVCQSSPPPGYYFIAANTACKTFTTKQGTVTTLSNTIAYPIASAVWRVTDGVKDINDQLTLIGPSTFTVSGGPSSVIIPIVDNGPEDFDARIGRLALKLPSTGLYSICETVPPVGYKNAAPSCKRVTVATGVPGNGGYFTNQELQVINTP